MSAEEAMLYLQAIGLEEVEREEITPTQIPATSTKPVVHKQHHTFVARIDGYSNKLVCERAHNPNMGLQENALPGNRVFADIGSLVRDLAQEDPQAAHLVLELVKRNLRSGYGWDLLMDYLPVHDGIPEPIYARD